MPNRPSLARRSVLRTALSVLSVASLLARLPAELHAAEDQGTEFWLAFAENGEVGELRVWVVGAPGTTGSVDVPGVSFSAPFSIPADGFASVALPTTAMVTASDGVESLGAHVVAGAPVIVYGVNLHAQTTDSFLALPRSALGTEYTAVTFQPFPSDPTATAAQITIVGTADGTQITITPVAGIGSHPPGSPYAIQIDSGDVYQGQSSGDLTGSSISASEPIAVLSGNIWTLVPSTDSFADHLVEQLVPTATWGTAFFVVPSAARTSTDIVRFQAGGAGANLTYSVNVGGPSSLPGDGFGDGSAPTAFGVSSNAPIGIAQLSRGGDVSPDDTGDPFLLQIAPVARYAHGYSIVTADDGTTFPSNFANLIVPAAAVGRVELDGVRIGAGCFAAIQSTGYSSCQLPISSGAHRLTGPLPFGATLYGFGSFVSYASPAGRASLPFVDGFEVGDTLAWSITSN